MTHFCTKRFLLLGLLSIHTIQSGELSTEFSFEDSTHNAVNNGLTILNPISEDWWKNFLENNDVENDKDFDLSSINDSAPITIYDGTYSTLLNNNSSNQTILSKENPQKTKLSNKKRKEYPAERNFYCHVCVQGLAVNSIIKRGTAYYIQKIQKTVLDTLNFELVTDLRLHLLECHDIKIDDEKTFQCSPNCPEIKNSGSTFSTKNRFMVHFKKAHVAEAFIKKKSKSSHVS